MSNELWVPPGVDTLAPSIGGRNVVTGGTIVIHTFKFHSEKYGKSREVKIPADDSMSQAQIEDMAASALETWIIELEEDAQRTAGKHAPSLSERKDVGKAIREFREYAAKRRESSTGQLYYPVAKVGE